MKHKKLIISVSLCLLIGIIAFISIDRRPSIYEVNLLIYKDNTIEKTMLVDLRDKGLAKNMTELLRPLINDKTRYFRLEKIITSKEYPETLAHAKNDIEQLESKGKQKFDSFKLQMDLTMNFSSDDLFILHEQNKEFPFSMVNKEGKQSSNGQARDLKYLVNSTIEDMRSEISSSVEGCKLK